MDQGSESGGLIALPAAEFEVLLELLAATGARRTLHEVGLNGQDAAEDIRDLCSLFAGFRLAKCTAVQTGVRLITTGILLALMAGIAIKLLLFGPFSKASPTSESPSPALDGSGLICAWRPPLTTARYNHWRDVPTARWRWKNFSPAVIACRGAGSLRVHEEALDKLQALRDRLGKPLIVRSAYRCQGHNRAVGGAPRSKHMDGTAFDIAMANHDPVAFEAAARAVGFLGFRYYPRSGFMHIDLGPARQWGERFPVPATAFAAETPPAREVLADSRTMKGSGAAGVATLGAAGVEVAQNVLAETQSAILPLLPHLESLRWVLIAVALWGVAVTICARIDDWKRRRR